MKKLKKSFFTVCALFLFSNCVKSYLNDPQIIPASQAQKDMLTTTSYNVPIIAGKTTYVVYESDTLAIATSPMTIIVPKSAIQTKANALNISYVDGTDPKAGVNQNWVTIAFEDSKEGDYDYNDLIIHVKTQYNSNGVHKIGIHAIALGSTKQIALGYKLFDNTGELYDKIITNDCRKDIFAGLSGFVNTDNKTQRFEKFSLKNSFTVPEDRRSNGPIYAVWYIKVDDGKNTFFSINDKYNALDANNRPYGIIVTDGGKTYWQDDIKEFVGGNWFTYPKEGTNISTCYPSFNLWLQGGALDLSNPAPETVFDIAWDNIQNEYLYTIYKQYTGL